MTEIRQAVDAFLADYDGVYAPITMEVRRRELARLAAHVERLASLGLVSTTDPAEMTVDDVKVIAVKLKDADVSVNTRVHMLGRLNLLCKYSGSMAVEMAKARYPVLFPAKREVRLDVLEPAQVRAIIEVSTRARAWRELRVALDTLIPLSTGARPQEVRMMKIGDVDVVAATIHIDVPKGSDTWGVPRTVPVLPEAVPVLERYISMALERGLTRGDYLFAGPSGDPVSGQTQRRWCAMLGEACGVEYDHRILRRTWGQSLIDSGIPEAYVSVLLGHASTETTARYYARVRERQAVNAVQRMWAERSLERAAEPLANPFLGGNMSRNSIAVAKSGEREGFEAPVPPADGGRSP